MTVDRMDDVPARPSPVAVMGDEMRPGERLVWADRPAPARLAEDGVRKLGESATG